MLNAGAEAAATAATSAATRAERMAWMAKSAKTVYNDGANRGRPVRMTCFMSAHAAAHTLFRRALTQAFERVRGKSCPAQAHCFRECLLKNIRKNLLAFRVESDPAALWRPAPTRNTVVSPVHWPRPGHSHDPRAPAKVPCLAFRAFPPTPGFTLPHALVMEVGSEIRLWGRRVPGHRPGCPTSHPADRVTGLRPAPPRPGTRPVGLTSCIFDCLMGWHWPAMGADIQRLQIHRCL